MSRKNGEFHKRKIQKFSKYSYVITLPVNWIKKYNLDQSKDENIEEWKEKVNPEVNIYEMPDGHLELYLDKGMPEPDVSMGRILLDEYLESNPNFVEEKTIQMILISYYMNGSKGLEIYSNKPIPGELIDQIENTQTKLLFNWNMSKISSRKVIVKNVFKERADDVFQEQIPRFLRESFAVLLGIMEDFIMSIENRNFKLIENVAERDNKIDRYYFFTVRQIRTVFEHPKLRKPLNFSHKKLVDLRLLAKFIEDVGDLFKETSQILSRIHKFIEEIQLMDYLKGYFQILHGAYSKLSDQLRKSLTQEMPSVGMNDEIMDLIEEYREEGNHLEEKWDEIIQKIEIGPLNSKYDFSDFFQGSRLVKNLEEIFKRIFDFTNLFF